MLFSVPRPILRHFLPWYQGRSIRALPPMKHRRFGQEGWCRCSILRRLEGWAWALRDSVPSAEGVGCDTVALSWTVGSSVVPLSLIAGLCPAVSSRVAASRCPAISQAKSPTICPLRTGRTCCEGPSDGLRASWTGILEAVVVVAAAIASWLAYGPESFDWAVSIRAAAPKGSGYSNTERL